MSYLATSPRTGQLGYRAFQARRSMFHQRHSREDTEGAEKPRCERCEERERQAAINAKFTAIVWKLFFLWVLLLPVRLYFDVPSITRWKWLKTTPVPQSVDEDATRVVGKGASGLARELSWRSRRLGWHTASEVLNVLSTKPATDPLRPDHVSHKTTSIPR